MSAGPRTVQIEPATPDRWSDLEQILGPRGAYGGCWCMFFRMAGREFETRAGETNRRSLRALVDDGPAPPGLLGYVDGDPAGWCAVAPRSAYARILRSPINKPAEDDDGTDPTVWAVTCFYIRRPHRHTGLARALLAAGVGFATEHGARIIEGYPKEPISEPAHPLSLFMGTPALFRSAGFSEYARRAESRPIMRYAVG